MESPEITKLTFSKNILEGIYTDSPKTNTFEFSVSQTFVQIFKSSLNPGELENTINFLQGYLGSTVTSTDDIAVFMELAQSEQWMIEIPLWCLFQTFVSPKDEYSAKIMFDVHSEVMKALEMRKVSIMSLNINSFGLKFFACLIWAGHAYYLL